MIKLTYLHSHHSQRPPTETVFKAWEHRVLCRLRHRRVVAGRPLCHKRSSWGRLIPFGKVDFPLSSGCATFNTEVGKKTRMRNHVPDFNHEITVLPVAIILGINNVNVQVALLNTGGEVTQGFWHSRGSRVPSWLHAGSALYLGC